eukprot:2313034-Prymnesium_polylepis.1
MGVTITAFAEDSTRSVDCSLGVVAIVVRTKGFPCGRSLDCCASTARANVAHSAAMTFVLAWSTARCARAERISWGDLTPLPKTA